MTSVNEVKGGLEVQIGVRISPACWVGKHNGRLDQVRKDEDGIAEVGRQSDGLE